MCRPGKSGALVKDNGFNSAFVIAHEIGHTLGMRHDGVDNDCVDSSQQGSIMAPIVKSKINLFKWSRCSKQELMYNIHKFQCIHERPIEKNMQDEFERAHSVYKADGK